MCHSLLLPSPPFSPPAQNKIKVKKGVLEKGILLNKRSYSSTACTMPALWRQTAGEILQLCNNNMFFVFVL